MKNIICKLTLGVLLFGAVVACDLDVYPRGSIVYSPGDQIITSMTDIEKFEANIMASMRTVTYGVYDYASDIEMDYFNAASDFGNNGGSIHRSDNSFTASNSEVESYWANMYNVIKNFNVFIEGSLDIPDGVLETADDTLKLMTAQGEAYFGRAYAYQCLARHFGKAYNAGTAESELCVPLVLVYDQNARPARNTVKEVYDQIKADLDSAAALLSGVKGEVRAVRPTADAVKAMYARYYLDTQNWANAAQCATELIDSATYSLCSTAVAFQNEWVYDSGTEPILQYYASLSEGTGGHSYYYSVGSMAGKYYTSEYYIPTKELVDSYSSNDLRWSTWFGTAHPSYNYTIMSYHNGTYYNETPSKPDYYVFSKYKGNPNYISGNYPNSAQARKALTIAEMYLIAAEALFNNGQTSDARNYLNELQTARGATKTSSITLESIKTEWYKETVGQGLRMSCLKRWGDGFDGRTPQNGAANIVMTGDGYDQKYLSPNAYQFVWPIPSYEMQVNDNLVQNPGYADLDEDDSEATEDLEM